MGSSSLTFEFLTHFGIQSFFKNEKRGGQKNVYFVVRADGSKQVMKILVGGIDARFTREMKIYEKYKEHPCIPVVYEVHEYQKETVIFEEYIEGHSLDEIESTYKGDNDKIKQLLRAIFDLMTPIWKDGVVHRDIKPANIIVRPDGTPVLIDFGVARDLNEESITAAGGLQPGTWKWAAPEQYAAKKEMINYRTDFFSLGVLAYYLYHQALPFGKTIDEINQKFTSGDETFNHDANCTFADFLIETLHFKVANRPRSIEELVKLI
ncbi:serine/threonine-protein kinase [Lacibacter cauensis]|uniref:non-specific serine/threonine protein kinase n=1 Tax=Lacibacter cauensis TaxID=510947 RepID=A0A562SPQ7_9BACT|nr:protein kinase [Lacibacter cauensis]TWI83259.1 serine/threonine-protein kinase [Lacibacter cauensis]